ncbi:hypothetical protein N0V90_002781 [Kalmusia sp. IMI 367209]|nr:hypothetical protein N0V90_002781 [Kalmusia sp. IMI 367209]
MVALSRHFSSTDNTDEFLVGTPPIRERNTTLSRKVQSELNLTSLANISTINSVPRSVDSGFSGKGDPLPDEVEHSSVILHPAVDCDAFIALQELGSLVARKRGIDADKFLTGLMRLFSITEDDAERGPDEESQCEERTTALLRETVDPHESPSTPDRTARHIGSARKRRRHFSFEPGDDQIEALEEKFKAHEMEDLYSSSSTDELEVGSDGQQQSLLHSLSAENQKSSKIPSPIQRPILGTVRREGSGSSVHIALGRSYRDERRSSQSSVMTAFRHNSGLSQQPVSQSRSSSLHTLPNSEGRPLEQFGSLGGRTNIAAIAAARAVDRAFNSSGKDATQTTSMVPAIGT